jgi:predicted ATP-binding protein involved in virulence
MRIDRLTITNFNGFDHRGFPLSPKFNLLVGDNASGKTSMLDALAIGVGSWFLGMRGLQQKIQRIEEEEVRVVAHVHQDSYTFEKQFPARIECTGWAMGKRATWARELNREEGRNSTSEAKPIIEIAESAERSVRSGEDVTIPLICNYGTERLWFEKKRRHSKPADNGVGSRPSRLDGYRDCLDFEIQETALIDWMRDQATVSTPMGKATIALTIVSECIAGCIEGANRVYYDGRYKDLVVVMNSGGAQLFRNLSDGQRIMLSMVGDLARRAVTLNPHLGNAALRETPGVVMVDELDLHLHPRWQRRVISDLKKSFPSCQFIATTHSPQLIGEARPEEILVLEGEDTSRPARSFGIDSSRILAEVMGAEPRDGKVDALLSRIARAIDDEDFELANRLLGDAEKDIGSDDPEITRARALMAFLEPNS